jgi:hypothetical protein
VRVYEVVMHERAWAVLAATQGQNRRRLLARLEALKSRPFQPGDFQQRDTTGRLNEVLLLDEWLVTYWIDHAVCEIHLVQLEIVDDQ